MELVKFKIKIIDNLVEIIPEDGFKDNSIYEIRLKNIESEDGEVLNDTITFCTKLSPLYINIQAVKSIISGVDISDENILYHIREASRFADYLREGEEPIDEDNVPFEVSQFVKYKAAYECLLSHMVNISSAFGISGTVGSVTFSEKETTKDISNLLEELAKLVKKWEDEVRGFKMEGRAKMKTAVKGSGFIDLNTHRDTPVPAYSPLNLNFKRGV